MLIARGRHNHEEMEQSGVGVPFIFHSDEDGTEEAIGGGGGGGELRCSGGIWECAKPKIKMTAMTRLDAEQIYPTDASHKLNNPCRVYLCVWRVCVRAKCA